ncbi:MAG: MBL fold metallo-hydrolase [Deltaproteobacteria bacterium]|nr:MBL fold metallo-hydrolase [Deltaproteobacteria bacterium]
MISRGCRRAGSKDQTLIPETRSPLEEYPMSLTVCVLGSGSKGNSTYVSCGDTSILLDAGLSGKEIERRMRSRGLRIGDINGIIVSHEHIDHIQGVGVLSRRYRIPVYATGPTLSVCSKRLGKLEDVSLFESGRFFRVGELGVHPFSVSHDSADPVGFTIQNGNSKAGIATDLGVSTRLVESHLRQCNLLILEANHDPKMLEDGPYPWEVKQRVRGRLGHLSNEQSKDLLGDLLHESLRHVILAHISKTNNDPEKACDTVCAALSGVKNDVPHLSAASQDEAGDVLVV